MAKWAAPVLPPGFRFHPTDEELVVQYLRRKAFGLPLPAAVIPDLRNLYKLDPWDIPGAASDGERYFFAVRPAAAATAGGGRCRGLLPATASGCWKPAGGRDKPVLTSRSGGRHLVGVKKDMVFVPRRGKGREAAAGCSWVMHEYSLALPLYNKAWLAQAEEWVVCRIFPRRRPAGHDARRTHQRCRSPSTSTSASSCVTSSCSSDPGQEEEEEEVSSG
ncbi:hypothetical protein GUJ93_ZPchr0010g11141 [Zizania palustris]|uniref:NAC domain-containing protein n=1 Tax=Zizania palustris TaxID=103762 RepID=A0A8J5WGG7_ZIZPA|nr:hypothetical protein GUJ93_ZPchr0010g11141 [Zizania palustris]